MFNTSIVLVVVVSLLHAGTVKCCDLEEYFTEKQVSVEESARDARVVFRGLSTNAGVSSVGGGGDGGGIGGAGTSTSHNEQRGVYTAYFELIDTYKGSDAFQIWGTNRQVNVTIFSRPVSDCNDAQDDIPREYIVFCQLFDGHLRATSIAKWDDSTDQRVWSSLGWGKWTEWSGCSVSCSAGIQQRTRRCVRPPCPGFNVEQRHCNLFGCSHAVNPLAVEEARYYHPSKDHWQHVPDRPNAWRLQPNNYIWLPSSQIFNNNSFPKEFSLFITLRILNESLGTVFSLRSRRRQDTYLSLEVAGGDLKLIHATSNGTDVVRIPASLDDHKWHQISISIRDNSVVDNYVDCQWSRTNILKVGSLDIPDDSDLIIGYLFAGDLEQLTIDPDPALVGLQCYSTITPIIDPSLAEQIFQSGKNPAAAAAVAVAAVSYRPQMSSAPVPTTIQHDATHKDEQIPMRNDFMHGMKKKFKRIGSRKWRN